MEVEGVRNVMTYTGHSPDGPRIALAVSEDLFHRKSLELATFEPVLTPLLKGERHGTVPNVVIPTGIDRRDGLGLPDRIDDYCGMADSRIGVARLDVPEHRPPGAPADDDGPKAGGQE